ncbi:GspE/PulE family protein [Tautonia sociabilis]|uniref:Type II/IV secretion system protein n=1 Tax=Tautonia sociabilis TaxID=2080755 RepID=A0A432MD50_9BACT|nr:GspE/PulE family protein [Tautonia sociabilis]RUL81613.1 type II/IV secretion system protein [Tautonia sociabilis]
MADDVMTRGEAGIDDEALVRALFDRQLLSTDRLLVAQRHAQEQDIPLVRALRDLHLVTPEDLERAITERRAELEAAQTEAGPAPPPAEPAGDEERAERDLRAELREIAATAVPSDLIEQIMFRALVARATDIHLDPLDDRYQVRFRIDGKLHQMVDLDRETGQAVVRGVKILAQMNLVEHRHPQDGALTIRYLGRAHNFRVSTLPTTRGEKVVLRVLEAISVQFDLGGLGLEPSQATLINQFLSRPYGAVLVGGPVGAGKTTTLYSCLERVTHPSRNVVTIEDPVEYRFSGVNQVEINTQIGLTFAQGLRAILRQDPDVLMIGEIRDDETAAIGIRAALTGVLVFSTIHASDAAGTVTSLFNYGVPGYTLSSALQGVVNQRLVRTICPNCRVGYKADETVIRALKLDPSEHLGLTLYRGRGCSACFHSGYHGRIGIFEVMDVSELIRELILLQTTKEVIRQVARDEGMKTLREAAITKVIEGVTTVEEMYRVTI